MESPDLSELRVYAHDALDRFLDYLSKELAAALQSTITKNQSNIPFVEAPHTQKLTEQIQPQDSPYDETETGLPISMDKRGRVYWKGNPTSVKFKEPRKSKVADLIESGGRMPIEIPDSSLSIEDYLKSINNERTLASRVNNALRREPSIDIELCVTTSTNEIYFRSRRTKEKIED